jgi:hypothetical protein
VGKTLARPLAEVPRRVLALAAIEEAEPDRGLVRHRQQRLQQPERRVVSPVEILEDKAQRGLLGQAVDEVREHLERLVLKALPVQVADALGGVRLEGQAKQTRDERVGIARGLAENTRQLGLEIEPDTGLRRRGADA